jgi:periplasmic protein TonB
VLVPAIDVTDVLRGRQHEADGPQTTATVVSVSLHVGLLAVMLFSPGSWFAAFEAEPKTVMTISLGDAAGGPATGGLTPIGGRAIQAATPLEAPRPPEPARPPAARTPEMTVPIPQAKPLPARPQPQVREAPADARGRTPTRGTETAPGSAVAETGVRGQGFGLSTGGGAGSGSRLDVADFCCPDYLLLMIERIRSNWNARAEAVGETMVKFTIERDGQIQGVEVEKSSGFAALDINAQRALLVTRTLPPLPAGFPNPTLTVHLNFQYTR